MNHNESQMSQATAKQLEKPSPTRVSVPVTGAMLHEIDERAQRLGVSRSVLLTRLLQWGLEAEKQKREQLAEKVRRLRETTDPLEAERLSDELSEMIFG
jgi:metal-responsive CopG/Arc/MetJ family transcriptional regulator